jgi:hypothetical protein
MEYNIVQREGSESIKFPTVGRIRIHNIPNIQSMALVALKTSQPIAEVRRNRGFLKIWLTPKKQCAS